jgi:hypothetical protein
MSIAEKLSTIAENEQKIYDAGRQAERVEIWENIQRNGARKAYTYGFAGGSWKDTTYFPIYDIVCDGTNAANHMFLYNDGVTDVKVTVILKNTVTTNSFASSGIKRIPLIKLVGNVRLNTAFDGASVLEYIRFAIPEDYPDENLSRIQNDVNFKDSKLLDRGSIENIVGCLSKTVTGKTLTVSNTAVTNAFTEDEWEALIAPYNNWTISRV